VGGVYRRNGELAGEQGELKLLLSEDGSLTRSKSKGKRATTLRSREVRQTRRGKKEGEEKGENAQKNESFSYQEKGRKTIVQRRNFANRAMIGNGSESIKGGRRRQKSSSELMTKGGNLAK